MSYKLLLADDSLTIQKVVELVLAPEGFEIRALNDGEQALRAMESFMPNIVLADIEMPKLNGYQLCEKIKNNMATAQIPVILLAGAFEPFDEEYAKSVFADDFIIKPFESQELISKVKALLVGFEPSKKEESEEIQEEIYEEEQVSVGNVPEVAVEAVPEPSVPAEGLKWDEEMPAAEEKPEEQAMADEEYEAKIALSPEVKDFEEELAEAMKKEEEPSQEIAGTPLEMPQQEEVRVISEQQIPEKITGEAIQEVSLMIKNSIETTISTIAPEIIENVTRELVNDLLQSLRGEIDTAIKRIVPEVAETIIRKEIEKITSEMG